MYFWIFLFFYRRCFIFAIFGIFPKFCLKGENQAFLEPGNKPLPEQQMAILLTNAFEFIYLTILIINNNI